MNQTFQQNQKISSFQDNSLSVATTINLQKAPSYQYLSTTRNKKKLWATQNANASDATKIQAQIIQKINQVIQSPQKSNPQFSKHQSLKIISSIYIEKLKQLKGTDKQTPLHILIYEFFLFKHGLKRIAESKLLQFLESIMQYSSSSQRISFFLQLFQEQDSTADFESFMQFAMYLDNTETLFGQEGILVDNSKVNAALTKVYSDMYSQKLSAVIKTQTWKDLQNELENVTNEKIDFDCLGPKIIQLNHELASQAIKKLKELYLAGDVDDDGSIGWDEFIMIVRHIENNKFTILSATQLYLSNCDQLVEGTKERTMTFQKFSLLAKEHNIFNKKSRALFASGDQEISTLDVLEKHWNNKKQLLIQRFEQVSCFTNFFANLIKKIDQYFSHDASSLLNEITIWYIYRFLTEESKFVILEAQVNDLIPEDFIVLFEAPLQIIQTKFQKEQ